MLKIGRNARCPCDSGKKYKHCCRWRPAESTFLSVNEQNENSLDAALQDELKTRKQKGQHKLIEFITISELRYVRVGQKLYSAYNCRGFVDFLSNYIVLLLGREWFASELSKMDLEPHPIITWHKEVLSQQRKIKPDFLGIKRADTTGAMLCYFGLAYGLYLMEHNASLQDSLIKRIRQSRNFQGHYYELIVASGFIRSGFKLAMENESDSRSGHCEFSAASNKTGRIYSVEAKTRGVQAILGKTEKDGTTQDNPAGSIRNLLKKAMKKPAQGIRVIFIDLNVGGLVYGTYTEWMDASYKAISTIEAEGRHIEKAFVIITDMAFHRKLSDTHVPAVAYLYGFNMPDLRVRQINNESTILHIKEKYGDIHDVMESIAKYPAIPNFIDEEFS